MARPRCGTDERWLKTMSVSHVERAVRSVMANAEEHGRWPAGNELAVRYALVDPVLWSLGWSTWSPLQCRPGFNLGQRGFADYALFAPDGNVAVLVVVGTEPMRRGSDRQRLMARARGMHRGLAVLTYGTRWEIYDLHIRGMRFTDKLVESLSLGWDIPDDPEEVARALYHWLRRELWWNSST